MHPAYTNRIVSYFLEGFSPAEVRLMYHSEILMGKVTNKHITKLKRRAIRIRKQANAKV